MTDKTLHRQAATNENGWKRARQLEERYYEARRATREEELRPLPAPRLWGWERYFFVRPDLARSPEGPQLARLLAVVQNVEISNRRDFAARDWEAGGKKVPQAHHPKSLTPAEFEALDPKLQRYFGMRIIRRKGMLSRKVFVVVEPWKLQTRTRRHIVTHEVIPNSEARSEVAFLENKLWGPAWLGRHSIRHRGRGYARGEYVPGHWVREQARAQEVESCPGCGAPR